MQENAIAPNIWEGLPVAILIVGLLLALNAVIGIARSTDLSGTAKALWVVFALLVPIVGAVAWFLYNKVTAAG